MDPSNTETHAQDAVANTLAQLDETMDFFKYSHSPALSKFTGTVCLKSFENLCYYSSSLSVDELRSQINQHMILSSFALFRFSMNLLDFMQFIDVFFFFVSLHSVQLRERSFLRHIIFITSMFPTAPFWLFTGYVLLDLK